MNTESSRFRPWSLNELRELPHPTWLVEGVIPDHGLAVVYGPSGSGKTFVVLDLSLCIAAGRRWHGHETVQGTVIYVSAEASLGVRQRVEAWEHHYGAEVGPFFVIREGVPLLDASAVSELIVAIEGEGLRPSLLVFDTLARCFGDGDENATQDMNKAVAAADRLAVHFDCAVVLVHHTGHQPGRERGSSALRAAADTMLKVRKRDTEVVVACDKQKDGETHPAIRFQLQEVPDVGRDPKGRMVGSCVVVGAGHAGQPEQKDLTRAQQQALAAFPAGQAVTPTATWLAATGLPERTFYQVRKDLMAGGHVTSPKKGMSVLTPKATQTLQHLHAGATAVTTTGIASAAPAHPPKGVQDSKSLQEEWQDS